MKWSTIECNTQLIHWIETATVSFLSPREVGQVNCHIQPNNWFLDTKHRKQWRPNNHYRSSLSISFLGNLNSNRYQSPIITCANRAPIRRLFSPSSSAWKRSTISHPVQGSSWKLLEASGSFYRCCHFGGRFRAWFSHQSISSVSRPFLLRYFVSHDTNWGRSNELRSCRRFVSVFELANPFNSRWKVRENGQWKVSFLIHSHSAQKSQHSAHKTNGSLLFKFCTPTMNEENKVLEKNRPRKYLYWKSEKSSLLSSAPLIFNRLPKIWIFQDAVLQEWQLSVDGRVARRYKSVIYG